MDGILDSYSTCLGQGYTYSARTAWGRFFTAASHLAEGADKMLFHGYLELCRLCLYTCVLYLWFIYKLNAGFTFDNAKSSFIAVLESTWRYLSPCELLTGPLSTYQGPYLPRPCPLQSRLPRWTQIAQSPPLAWTKEHPTPPPQQTAFQTATGNPSSCKACVCEGSGEIPRVSITPHWLPGQILWWGFCSAGNFLS